MKELIATLLIICAYTTIIFTLTWLIWKYIEFKKYKPRVREPDSIDYSTYDNRARKQDRRELYESMKRGKRV